MEKIPTPKKWTKSEEKFLKNNYHLIGINAVADKLHRSFYSVKTKARDIGIMDHKKSSWTDWQKRYLERYIGKKSLESIARTLGKTPLAVSEYLKKGELPKPVVTSSTKHTKSWTVEDDLFLRAMYGKLTRDEIAQKLKRTPKAVARRAERLKLKVKK